MVEKLPKNCSLVLDNLAKCFGSNLTLGVKIECGKLGNRFKLSVASKFGKFDQTEMLVKVDYNDVNVPGIKKLLADIWPDFLLKPTKFMPIDYLTDKIKLDKESLAAAILTGIRAAMTRYLSGAWYAEHGVSVYIDKVDPEKVKFKSFTEFLVWVDLNVK